MDPLTLDARLCAIASVRAREIAEKWSHTRPDGSSGVTVLTEYGYSCAKAVENLYFGTGSGDSIVSKWMSSEQQKFNMLMKAAAMGVGSYTAPDGMAYVVAILVK